MPFDETISFFTTNASQVRVSLRLVVGKLRCRAVPANYTFAYQ